MKRRLWFIGLVLALVLAVATPAIALAAKPVDFHATGTMTYITTGDVFPAGESGRWVVVERTVWGTFQPGNITGDFTFTYKANVELLTQAGNLHGTLETGEYALEVNGKIEPLEFVTVPGFPVDLPKLTISGLWAFTEGARGQGYFDAWLIFVPTPDGHVGWIINSAFTLDGKWQP